MAFVHRRGDGSYLKTTVVNVDSETDKENQEQSDYLYTAILNAEIQDVVSISITSWNLNRDIAPSFWPPNGNVAGNDTIDFTVSNANVAAGAPYTFSVQLPNKTYYYASDAPTDVNFADVLQTLMNAQIATEAALDGITVDVAYGTDEQFIIVGLVTNKTFYPGLDRLSYLSLLFSSGTNADRAAYAQLGFDQQDYTSYEQFASVGIGGVAATAIVGPNVTNLQQFKYIDVIVRESNKVPLKRIYLTNPNAFRSGTSDATYRQAKIDTDQPPGRLKKLTIGFRLQGNLDPRLYQSASVPNQFTFAVLQVAQENDPRTPAYVKQILTS